MEVTRAYTTITLEARFGGYDTKELHIVANENELEITFLPDYVFIAQRVNCQLHTDEFPRKNWDKRLWKLIWARFRGQCQE